MIHFGEHLKCYRTLSYRRCHWDHVTCCKAGWCQAELGTYDMLSVPVYSLILLGVHSLREILPEGRLIVNLYQQIQSSDKHTLVIKSKTEKLRSMTSDCLGARDDTIGDQVVSILHKECIPLIPRLSCAQTPAEQRRQAGIRGAQKVQPTWKKEPSPQDLLFCSETSW